MTKKTTIDRVQDLAEHLRQAIAERDTARDEIASLRQQLSDWADSLERGQGPASGFGRFLAAEVQRRFIHGDRTDV